MVRCKKKTQYELHLWISQERIAWLKCYFHRYWCQIKYSNVKLKIKNSSRKASHGVEGNNTSESCKSKTPTSSTSLPSPLNYETSIIESNKDTVRDTYHSLKEKVNLLNIEIIAMKSFIEDQLLIQRQSRKDLALQKLYWDHNSEIARLTEEIAYLRNEKITKVTLYRHCLKMTTQSKNPR